MRADIRTRVELAAFRRLRLALIAANVPHAIADDLARERVDSARGKWRNQRETSREGFGRLLALYHCNPRNAVPAILRDLQRGAA